MIEHKVTRQDSYLAVLHYITVMMRGLVLLTAAVSLLNCAAAVASAPAVAVVDVAPLFDPASTEDAVQKCVVEIDSALSTTGVFVAVGAPVDELAAMRAAAALFSSDAAALDKVSDAVQNILSYIHHSLSCFPLRHRLKYRRMVSCVAISPSGRRAGCRRTSSPRRGSATASTGHRPP